MQGSLDNGLRGYRTVARFAETETVINRSRFIGAAWPIESEEEARALLAEVRKRRHDATHNCYAYSVERGAVCRFSDDGEPGGTAGLPMMEVIKQKGVTNVLVVVTRWFGGILLGAGGLVRAYSGAAAKALDAAGPVELAVGQRLAVTLDYARFALAEPYIRSLGDAKLTFTDTVSAELLVKLGDADGVRKRLAELTDGRASVEERGEAYIKLTIPCEEETK